MAWSGETLTELATAYWRSGALLAGMTCGLPEALPATAEAAAQRLGSDLRVTGMLLEAWQALGLRHLLTRPYTPQTNGKAERFIKTMLQDWAYAVPYGSSDSRNRQLPRWLNHYNQLRPHSAIGGLPPTSRLTRSVNNLPGLHT